MNPKKCFGFLSGLYLAANLLQSTPALADDYPPALNYDDFTESVLVGNEDGNMYFAKKIRSVHFYTPGRDVQVRTDVVDAKGNILSTKEYVRTSL